MTEPTNQQEENIIDKSKEVSAKKTIVKKEIAKKFDNYELDPSKFKYKEVVYLIELPEKNEYKFGITNDILSRLDSHKKSLKYIEVIKCWNGLNRTITSTVEDNIKRYAKHEQINVIRGTLTELLKTDDITKIIKVIDNLVKKFTDEHMEQFVDKRLKQKEEIVNKQLTLIDEINKLIKKGFSPDVLTDMFNLTKRKELKILPKSHD